MYRLYSRSHRTAYVLPLYVAGLFLFITALIVLAVTPIVTTVLSYVVTHLTALSVTLSNLITTGASQW